MDGAGCFRLRVRSEALPPRARPAAVGAADPDLPHPSEPTRGTTTRQGLRRAVPLARLERASALVGARVTFGNLSTRAIHRGRELSQGPAALTLRQRARILRGHVRRSRLRCSRTPTAPGRLISRTTAHCALPMFCRHRSRTSGRWRRPVPGHRTDVRDVRRPGRATVVLEPGLPVQDMQPGGLVSGPMSARMRLARRVCDSISNASSSMSCAPTANVAPSARFASAVLVQAAHIVPDVEPQGIAAVVNGLALCAIHHLAFDRNLLGIDPSGTVHIADRLRREIDGRCCPMGCKVFTASRSSSRDGQKNVQIRHDSSRGSAQFLARLRKVLYSARQSSMPGRLIPTAASAGPRPARPAARRRPGPPPRCRPGSGARARG